MIQIAVHCSKCNLHLRCFSPYSFALRHMLHIVRMTNDSSLTRRCGVFQVAKAVSHSLNNCVNCLPGQKDVDMALRSIGEASKKLLVDIVSLLAEEVVLPGVCFFACFFFVCWQDYTKFSG